MPELDPEFQARVDEWLSYITVKKKRFLGLWWYWSVHHNNFFFLDRSGITLNKDLAEAKINHRIHVMLEVETDLYLIKEEKERKRKNGVQG